MSAVERFSEYINKKEIEANWELPKAPISWPSHGVCEI